MKRREFLSLMAATALAPQALARPRAWRSIRYKDNPGLLKIFMKRYSEFHEREFFPHFKHWPKSLTEAWREDFSKPRDFGQSLGGTWIWPRFQWEYRFGQKQNSAIIHWFDLEEPANLRALWKKSLNVPGDDWCGITYDASSGEFVTHVKVSGIKKLGYEPWALRSGIETTYFMKSGDLNQTFKDEKLLYTRYFSERTLNVTVGSFEERTLRKVAAEFMLQPSSYALWPDQRVRGLYYP